MKGFFVRLGFVGPFASMSFNMLFILWFIQVSLFAHIALEWSIRIMKPSVVPLQLIFGLKLYSAPVAFNFFDFCVELLRAPPNRTYLWTSLCMCLQYIWIAVCQDESFYVPVRSEHFWSVDCGIDMLACPAFLFMKAKYFNGLLRGFVSLWGRFFRIFIFVNVCLSTTAT